MKNNHEKTINYERGLKLVQDMLGDSFVAGLSQPLNLEASPPTAPRSPSSRPSAQCGPAPGWRGATAAW